MAHQRLTGEELRATMSAVTTYWENPSHPGLNLHRVEGPDPDMWSIRATRDIRIIIHKSESRSVFLYVDHHDAAYEWAKRRRLSPHEVTNVAQLVVIDERTETRVVPRFETAQEPGPFAALDDETLLGYGVPREWIARIRATPSIEDFMEFGDDLPEAPREYLTAIAFGTLPPRPERARDPFDHPDALREFATVHDDMALAKALSSSWAEWQLFLHPSQRAAVQADHAGPARVTGGPGTGKSVVAVHRAAHIARTHRGRVLLTSFSRTLAERLSRDVDDLLTEEPVVRQRIDVVHLHQFAIDTLKSAGLGEVKILNNDQRDGIIDEAVSRHPGVATSLGFVRSEWNLVIDPLGIKTVTEYLSADRDGRGSPIGPPRRRKLWPIFEDILALLTERGWTTWSSVCWQVAAMYERQDDGRPFDHVIADEVQDFGPAEMWLLRSIVPEGRNDVFLAGDSNQRIFKPRTRLARSGLEVRGRSTLLRLSYRTTAQIRQLAERLLVLDPNEEDTSTLSLRTGPDPDVRLLHSVNDEMQSVARWLRKLTSNGVRPDEIAILARTANILKDRGRKVVAMTGHKAHELKDDADTPRGRIVLGTLHRSKGLQFRAVAIIGVEEATVPPASVLDRQPDAASRDALLELERNLLYVGCTRARDHLLITGARRRSSLMSEIGHRAFPS